MLQSGYATLTQDFSLTLTSKSPYTSESAKSPLTSVSPGSHLTSGPPECPYTSVIVPRVPQYISQCPQSGHIHQSLTPECPYTSVSAPLNQSVPPYISQSAPLHFHLGLVAVGWEEQTLIKLMPSLNCRCAVLQPAEA